MSVKTVLPLHVLSLALLASLDLSNAIAQDRLSTFMKRKLEHAGKMLEGLAKEDFDAITADSQGAVNTSAPKLPGSGVFA